jgi:hypothetical protein
LTMKKVSTKQAAKNREVALIKATKPDICVFCGVFCGNADLAHLLPKSVFPQYYTEERNLWKAHRFCHTKFDDGTKEYRATFTHIVEIVRSFATKGEVYQYFGI